MLSFLYFGELYLLKYSPLEGLYLSGFSQEAEPSRIYVRVRNHLSISISIYIICIFILVINICIRVSVSSLPPAGGPGHVMLEFGSEGSLLSETRFSQGGQFPLY